MRCCSILLQLASRAPPLFSWLETKNFQSYPSGGIDSFALTIAPSSDGSLSFDALPSSSDSSATIELRVVAHCCTLALLFRAALAGSAAFQNISEQRRRRLPFPVSYGEMTTMTAMEAVWRITAASAVAMRRRHPHGC